MMYQDNSLWSATRLQQRLMHGQKMRQQKRERELIKLQTIVDKRALAAYYKENYGIRIDSTEVERLTEK